MPPKQATKKAGESTKYVTEAEATAAKSATETKKAAAARRKPIDPPPEPIDYTKFVRDLCLRSERIKAELGNNGGMSKKAQLGIAYLLQQQQNTFVTNTNRNAVANKAHSLTIQHADKAIGAFFFGDKKRRKQMLDVATTAVRKYELSKAADPKKPSEKKKSDKADASMVDVPSTQSPPADEEAAASESDSDSEE